MNFYRSLILCSCVLVLSGVTSANALSRQKRQANDDVIALLENIIDQLKEMDEKTDEKRSGFDGGYGSRYGAARRVGAKLMALKQASDWNGPGR